MKVPGNIRTRKKKKTVSRYCIPPRIIGYARVNTNSPADVDFLNWQKGELMSSGITHFIYDTYPKGTMSNTGIQTILKDMCCNDSIVVTSLDRLAGSIKDALEIIDTLLDIGASVTILNMGTFNKTEQGQMVRRIAGAFESFERDVLIQRMAAGKIIARESDDYKEGRPRKFTQKQLEHAMKLLQTKSYAQVSKSTGISISTLKRYKREKRTLE